MNTIMTAERRAYILKRVARLTERLDRLDGAYAAHSHSGHPDDVRTRALLKKDHASTLTSLKRWEKLLREFPAA